MQYRSVHLREYSCRFYGFSVHMIKIIRKLLLTCIFLFDNINKYEFFFDLPNILFVQLSTGTTLVAVEFDGGVVIGADSKTSMGTWVANRSSNSLIQSFFFYPEEISQIRMITPNL